MRLLWAGLAGLIVAGLLAGGLAWYSYQQFLGTALMIPAQGIVVDVRRGDNLRSVISRLASSGITVESWHWRLLTRLEPTRLHAGEFRLRDGMVPRQVLAKLAGNDVVQYSFTLVEGWDYRQVVAALQSLPALEPLPESALATDQVMTLIGSEHSHPEGWFLPETYAYVRGENALDLLGRAHQAMQESLATAWAGRDDELPLETPYQLLILASIVEKETAVAAERAEVAGVFTRRLQQRWRLETDPTVIYGLGEAFDGNLRRVDLRTDTPYNTYMRHGLPPTPIAMPGADALLASARPAQGEAMFFVADGEGGHVFSVTLQDHNRAVRELVRRQTGKP